MRLRQLEFARRLFKGEEGFESAGEDGLHEAREGCGDAVAQRFVVDDFRLREIELPDAMRQRGVVMVIVAVVIVAAVIVVAVAVVGIIAVLTITIASAGIRMQRSVRRAVADHGDFAAVGWLLLMHIRMQMCRRRRRRYRGGKSRRGHRSGCRSLLDKRVNGQIDRGFPFEANLESFDHRCICCCCCASYSFSSSTSFIFIGNPVFRPNRDLAFVVEESVDDLIGDDESLQRRLPTAAVTGSQQDSVVLESNSFQARKQLLYTPGSERDGVENF